MKRVKKSGKWIHRGSRSLPTRNGPRNYSQSMHIKRVALTLTKPPRPAHIPLPTDGNLYAERGPQRQWHFPSAMQTTERTVVKIADFDRSVALQSTCVPSFSGVLMCASPSLSAFDFSLTLVNF